MSHSTWNSRKQESLSNHISSLFSSIWAYHSLLLVRKISSLFRMTRSNMSDFRSTIKMSITSRDNSLNLLRRFVHWNMERREKESLQFILRDTWRLSPKTLMPHRVKMDQQKLYCLLLVIFTKSLHGVEWRKWKSWLSLFYKTMHSTVSVHKIH